MSATVSIHSSTGTLINSVFTNVHGSYVSESLPAGSYLVKAVPSSSPDLVGELYNNLPCPKGTCAVTSGTPVVMPGPSGVSNIDFALAPGGRITGTVTNASTGAPVLSTIRVYSVTGVQIGLFNTDSQGTYSSMPLPTGSYFLTAVPLGASGGVLAQLYHNLPCPNGICTATSGTPVSVSAPNVKANINFALQKGATITGTVTNAATGAPVSQVSVKISSPTGIHVEAVTNSQGIYTTFQALETGTYFAWADAQNTSGLVDQLHSNLPCPNASCNPTSGTPIAVTAPNATTINFALLQAPQAINDSYATAIVVNSLPYQSIVNTSGATMGAEDPVVECASSGNQKSVWYVFTPTVDGPVAVNTFGSSYNTILSIYTGSPGSFTPLACIDDISSTWSSLTVEGTAGQQLAILVTTDSQSGGLLVVNVGAVPGAFGKVSPAHGTAPATVTLSWGPSTDAQAYEYCLDTIHNGFCSAGWVSVGNSTSVLLTGLVPGTQYSWHVRAVNVAATTYAQGSGSAFWSFIPIRVPFVDLNGDRLGDAFVHNPETGAWQRQISQGDGSFATVSGTWGAGWKVSPAVFDADALTDFFLFNTTSGEWLKLLSTTDGYTVQESGAWWQGWERFVLDLDGDGLSDFFLYDPATGTWFKCLSTPTGFTYSQGAWNPGWEIYPMRLNDDAFGDLFLIDRATGRWFWVLGAADGVFTYPASAYWLPDWQLYPGDFNGDGLSDLFLYHSDAGEYYVAFNTGTGFTYVDGYGWMAGWTPYVADLDADGKDDLFLHNADTGWWFQMIGDGAGHFTDVGSHQWVLGWDLYFSDFNGDGRADILLYDTATGVWYQARNLVNGAFTYTNGVWAPGLSVITKAPNR